MDSIVNVVRVVAYLAVGGMILVGAIFAVVTYMYKKNQFKGD